MKKLLCLLAALSLSACSSITDHINDETTHVVGKVSSVSVSDSKLSHKLSALFNVDKSFDCDDDNYSVYQYRIYVPALNQIQSFDIRDDERTDKNTLITITVDEGRLRITEHGIFTDEAYNELHSKYNQELVGDRWN